MKPYSDSCERNRAPILEVLKHAFSQRKAVLEIGSGTGQHAAYFAPELPHLVWQPTDVAEHLAGIGEWTQGITNVRAPLEFDVDQAWPNVQADAAYTANTCHIMSWAQVAKMFEGVGRLLPKSGVFAVYGPFNYGGKHTSESNARFDAMLRARDPLSGIRDFEAVRSLAEQHGLELDQDHAMPANNRLLVFRKGS